MQSGGGREEEETRTSLRPTIARSRREKWVTGFYIPEDLGLIGPKRLGETGRRDCELRVAGQAGSRGIGQRAGNGKVYNRNDIA